MKKTYTTVSNPRFWLGFILLCSLGLFVALFCFSALPGASAASLKGQGANHKVSVTDRHLVDSLTAQGGKVIADYGSYVLLSVNDSLANSLQGNRGAQIMSDYNKVLLNSGAID